MAARSRGSRVVRRGSAQPLTGRSGAPWRVDGEGEGVGRRRARKRATTRGTTSGAMRAASDLLAGGLACPLRRNGELGPRGSMRPRRRGAVLAVGEAPPGERLRGGQRCAPAEEVGERGHATHRGAPAHVVSSGRGVCARPMKTAGREETPVGARGEGRVWAAGLNGGACARSRESPHGTQHTDRRLEDRRPRRRSVVLLRGARLPSAILADVRRLQRRSHVRPSSPSSPPPNPFSQSHPWPSTASS